MTRLTRRALLGSSGAVLGLAACQQETAPLPEAESRIQISADDRPGYPGSVSFDHGVASGDPLSDRVVLWTRVSPDGTTPASPIPVSFTVYADPELETPVSFGLASANPGADYTVKVDASGLEPGRVYHYQFIAKTTSGEVASPVGRTKTTNSAGDAAVRLAVVSCSNFPFGQFHVYREIAEDSNLDAVIHLGDYIYEYGIDGYGGSVGQAIGRNHEPPLETVSLEDYRIRHAQYKSDPNLQAAHAVAPWLCTWDDHESTNNSYRSGAENHNPEAGEGNWTDRKQVAVQAYLEWMPVRDPEADRARESIYRRFNFGDVASVMCLESRLTGRSDEISWFTELGGLEPEQVPMKALSVLGRVNDPSRTMLGGVQESWLADQLSDSVQTGTAWQVLANQVVMARVKPPNFTQTLTPEQVQAQEVGYVQQLIPFSLLGFPLNLDSWDGFPAARDRLYTSAKEAGAKLVTLTGDTHTAWANTLKDGNGDQRGVEFGCTSVTSPGMGTYFRGVPDLGKMFADANDEVDWHDPYGSGFTLVTLMRDSVQADFVKVTDVTEVAYSADTVASYRTELEDGAMRPLSRL